MEKNSETTEQKVKGINFNVTMIDPDDQVVQVQKQLGTRTEIVKDDAGNEHEVVAPIVTMVDWTMKDAIINALLNPIAGDEKKTGLEKMELYGLYMKIKKAGDGPVVLEPEELTTIKQRVGIKYPSLTVGQIWDFIQEHIGK